MDNNELVAKLQRDMRRMKVALIGVSGAMIAAFCLTESGAGSDAASIRTQAVKNPDGNALTNGLEFRAQGNTAGDMRVAARAVSPTVSRAESAG